MHIQYEREDPECLTSFVFEETEVEQLADFQSWLKENGMSYKKIRVPGGKTRMICLIVEKPSFPVAKQEAVQVVKTEPILVRQEPVVVKAEPVVKHEEPEEEDDVSEAEEEVKPVEQKKSKFVEDDEEPEDEDEEEVSFKQSKKDKKKDKKKK